MLANGVNGTIGKDYRLTHPRMDEDVGLSLVVHTDGLRSAVLDLMEPVRPKRKRVGLGLSIPDTVHERRLELARGSEIVH